MRNNNSRATIFHCKPLEDPFATMIGLPDVAYFMIPEIIVVQKYNL